MNGEGWYFLKLDELKKNEKSYTVTMKDAKRINRQIGQIVG